MKLNPNCGICGTIKTQAPSGLYCKPCATRRGKEWYAANKSKATARNSAWYKANKARHHELSRRWQEANTERKRELAREWGRNNPDNVRDKHLRRMFGIGLQEWEDLFTAQDRVCKICKSDDPRGRYGWHTDHKHPSGPIRGILCRACNHLLGHADDHPDVLRAAALYLEAHQ